MWYFHMNNGEKIPFDLANSFELLKKKDIIKFIENHYFELGKWYTDDNRIINLDNIAFIEKE